MNCAVFIIAIAVAVWAIVESKRSLEKIDRALGYPEKHHRFKPWRMDFWSDLWD